MRARFQAAVKGGAAGALPRFRQRGHLGVRSPELGMMGFGHGHSATGHHRAHHRVGVHPAPPLPPKLDGAGEEAAIGGREAPAGRSAAQRSAHGVTFTARDANQLRRDGSYSPPRSSKGSFTPSATPASSDTCEIRKLYHADAK